MRADTVVVRFVIRAVPALVPVARHRVIAQLRGNGVWLDDDAADAIELVLTELVTNALVHTESKLITLGVYVRGLRAVLDVHDGSHALPLPRTVGGESTGGRGLELVAALSLSHGWAPTEGGKHCWAEMALPPAPRALVRRQLMQSPPRPRQHVGLLRPRPCPYSSLPV